MTRSDIAAELSARGQTGGEQALLTYIAQAEAALRCYCGIEENAALPEGLRYAWAALAEHYASGGGGIASISEGDVSVGFSGAGGELPAEVAIIARHYRRMG